MEGREPPEALTLGEWLCRPAETGQDMFPLRATITARGMAELDWSMVTGGLAQETGGSGRIAMAIPATSLDFYTRLFLRLGAEATVMSPPALIAALRHEATAILSLYDADEER